MNMDRILQFDQLRNIEDTTNEVRSEVAIVEFSVEELENSRCADVNVTVEKVVSQLKGSTILKRLRT